MTLTALIGAYHESSEPGDGLRATLPLAGRTLLERQARLAADAGAQPIIVVIEREPPELAAAVNRLRAEGLDILVARSAGEAAKAVQANDHILLFADGLLPEAGHVRRVAENEGPALLTVPDIRFDDRFERIDAESRWGGLALIDGATLKHTAAMLQDWDLQSTLLRRAVQSGARHLGPGGDPGAPGLIVAERSGDLAQIENDILTGAGTGQKDWVSRYLLAPVEQAATRRLMGGPVGPSQIWLAGLLLALGSAFFFSRGWLWTGLFLVLAATPLDGIAARLTRLRMHGAPPQSWLGAGMPLAAAASLIALGYALALTGGWGSLVLAAAAIAFLAALDGERSDADVPGGMFLAEPKGMAWLMLPFAAAGQWVTGLGALAVYAAASFFWMQRRVHRPADKD